MKILSSLPPLLLLLSLLIASLFIDQGSALVCNGITCGPATPCVPNVFCGDDDECVYEPLDCDDGNACTMDDCDPVLGICFPTLVTCPVDTQCTTYTCDPEQGCVADTVDCEDNDPCTTEFCDPTQGCTYDAVDCNDFDACTTEYCDPSTGCVFDTKSCDDGDLCTEDYCDASSGDCYTNPLYCGDSDACTTRQCNPGWGCEEIPYNCGPGDACNYYVCDTWAGCLYQPIDCGYYDECTVSYCDTSLGGCQSYPAPCDDGNDCTTDHCSPGYGCTSDPMNCDDGNACSNEYCSYGSCIYDYVDCNDNNACTQEYCDPSTGVCTYDGVTCDDNDPCTTDSCDSGSGCVYDYVGCSTGTVVHDPHFVGFHGKKYDVQGEPEKWFNIITDNDIQLNAFFHHQSYAKHALSTHMAALGFMVMDDKGRLHRMLANQTGVFFDDEELTSKGANVPGVKVVMETKQRMTRVLTPAYDIHFQQRHNYMTKATQIKEPFYNLEASMIDDERNPHGLLGQTANINDNQGTNNKAEGTKAKAGAGVAKRQLAKPIRGHQGEGVIEGTYADYEVSSAHSTDFKFNKFLQQ